MSEFNDMRGAMEDEDDVFYFCNNCKEWFSMDRMYNDRICEHCYYHEI